jgi:hypothetical protein
MLNRQDLVERLVSSRTPAQAMALLRPLANSTAGEAKQSDPVCPAESSGKSKEKP